MQFVSTCSTQRPSRSPTDRTAVSLRRREPLWISPHANDNGGLRSPHGGRRNRHTELPRVPDDAVASRLGRPPILLVSIVQDRAPDVTVPRGDQMDFAERRSRGARMLAYVGLDTKDQVGCMNYLQLRDSLRRSGPT
jgi:hypothetical protein